MEDLDDPFDLEDEDEEPEPDPAAQAAAKELETLRSYKAHTETAAREAAVISAFKEAGLNTRAAKLYGVLHPEGDPTAESVKEFASDYSIGPEPDRSGYTPTVIQGERATPSAKTYSRSEMEVIARENPARARALADSGRVKWNNPEVGKR